MSLKITSSQLSVASAIALIIAGIILFFIGFQNVFVPILIIGALSCLWFSQNPPRQKLSTIGLVASSVGILFIASLNLFPIFHEIRNTSPTIRFTNPIYFSGMAFFCGMSLVNILGFILLGISIIQDSNFPKALGVSFIIAGIVPIGSVTTGPILTISGLFWLFAIRRKKRQAEAEAYLKYLSED